MNKTYKVIISATKLNRIARVNKTVEIVQGSTTHIQAKGGERFELHDAQTDISPSTKKIITKRVGNHLHIQFEGSTQPDLIIDNYYNADSLPNEFNGVNEDGTIFDYVISESNHVIEGVDLANVSASEAAGGGMMEALSDIALPLGLALAAGGAGVAFGMSGGGNSNTSRLPSLKKPVVVDGGSIPPDNQSHQNTNQPISTPRFSIQKVPTKNTVQLLVDGQVVESTLEIDDKGNYYLVPKNPLSDGEHKITYRFFTASGKANGTSVQETILIDTIIPNKPETQPSIVENTTEGTNNQTEVPSGQVTINNTKPSVQIGQIQKGTTPKLIVNGKVVESVITTDEKGNVTLTPKSPISEGSHEITYRVLTPSLRPSSESEPLKLVIDATPPIAPTIAPDMTPETDEGVSRTDNIT
ncbi:MAG: hypothetical protein RL674_819, partial [Pseudomonadota bacterium]